MSAGGGEHARAHACAHAPITPRAHARLCDQLRPGHTPPPTHPTHPPPWLARARRWGHTGSWKSMHGGGRSRGRRCKCTLGWTRRSGARRALRPSPRSFAPRTPASHSLKPPTHPPAGCRELCDLIKEVQPAARRPQARLRCGGAIGSRCSACSRRDSPCPPLAPAPPPPLAPHSFALVYPDRRGRHVMRQVGQVHATRLGEDDSKTLGGLSFQTGDYMDVAIY